MPRGNVAPALDVGSVVKVTVAPETRLSNLSRTVTRRLSRLVPTCAICGVPEVARMLAGVPDGPIVMVEPNVMMLELPDAGVANRGIIPVVKPVWTVPDDVSAVPVGPRMTCAVTGVDGKGKVAVPSPTFVQVIQRTSMLAWSTGELKSMVKTVDAEVTVVVDNDAPPGSAGAVPLEFVRTAEHPEMSRPGGMLLNATFTCTLEALEFGNTPPVLN